MTTNRSCQLQSFDHPRLPAVVAVVVTTGTMHATFDLFTCYCTWQSWLAECILSEIGSIY